MSSTALRISGRTGITVGAKKLAVRNSPMISIVRLSYRPSNLDGPTNNKQTPIKKHEMIRVKRFSILSGMYGVKNVPMMYTNAKMERHKPYYIVVV